MFFAGDIDAFMGDEVLIFDDIRDLLDQQFARLAALERDILLWLAIEREPITEAQLWQAVAHTSVKRSFLRSAAILAAAVAAGALCPRGAWQCVRSTKCGHGIPDRLSGHASLWGI